MDIDTLLSYPWRIMMPEFTILGIVTIVSLLDLFMREKIDRKILAYISLGGIGVALCFLFVNIGQPVQEILFETYRLDGFANAFKFLFLVGAAVIFILSLDYVNGKDVPYEGEFYYLILTAVLGAMILASSADMITLFVGLELLSISSYILVGARKYHRRANESALKYVISGTIATAVMLYGMSFIYGLTGTTNLFEISERLFVAFHEQGQSFLIYFAFFVTLIGMAFKISVVPFHMWAPDVYEGAATPVTAFLSVVSKAAGFALILRFFMVAFIPLITDIEPDTGMWISLLNDWAFFIAIIAAASMIIGNIMALRQTNVKRMFAYSSIAQAGYILVPFAVAGELFFRIPHLFFENAFFYLLAYLFMNLGAFAMIQLVTQEEQSEDIKAFAGLYRRAPYKTVAMIFFLLSLAGIPLTAGFIGKFYIFMGSIEGGNIWLATVMMITSVISYYYYFGLMRQMFLRPAADRAKPLKTPLGTGIVLVFCLAGTILLGIVPQIAFDFIHLNFDGLDIFYPAE